MLDYELEQLIKDALKDYRGNNKIVVITSLGGSIDIVDYDEDPLVSEKEELEDKILKLEQENKSLVERINELEEEL